MGHICFFRTFQGKKKKRIQLETGYKGKDLSKEHKKSKKMIKF